MVIRLYPLTKMALDSLAKRIHTFSHEGIEWEVQLRSLPFSLGLQAMILPQYEAIGYGSRTDVHFRQARACKEDTGGHRANIQHTEPRDFQVEKGDT